MKALIHDGIVIQMEATEFPVHSSLIWVTASKTTKTGDLYANGKFTHPVVEKKTYREQRKNQYPEIGSQLDAIWKQFVKMRLDGQTLVKDTDNMLNDVLVVKTKYPKV